MGDPTYERDKIEANDAWRIAFVISECINDSAPIGWGKYIWIAEAILRAEKAREPKS